MIPPIPPSNESLQPLADDPGPVSADLAAILENYPGPALVVSLDDEILAANRLAQTLLAEDRNWWDAIAVWRSAALAGLSSHRSVPVNRPDTPMIYEWVAVQTDESRLLLLGRDATLERRLRHTLTESRQRYKDLVEISSDFAWETGADGRFVFVSPRGALGFPAEDLVGRHPRELTLVGDADVVLPFESRRPTERADLWLRGSSGDPAYLQIAVKPLFGSEGTWVGARGVCRDLTGQVLKEAELSRVRNRERVLNHIVHTLRDQVDAASALEVAARETTLALETDGCGIYRLDDTGTAHATASYGDSLVETLPAATLSTLLAQAATSTEPVAGPAGALSLLACRTRFRQIVNGTVCVWRDGTAPPWDEDARSLLAGVADRIGITHAQLAYQEHLRHLSERDSLTGLFNRRTFLERLTEMIGWREFGPSALLYMDLDNFKAVNDQRGHQQGDEVLKAVGTLISAGVRPGDLCGRMGGDEFVLWLARADKATAMAVARRLLAGMETLRALSASDEKPLGMSIGIAVRLPTSEEGIAALIERADSAMYQAKLHGKASFSLAAPAAAAKSDAP